MNLYKVEVFEKRCFLQYENGETITETLLWRILARIVLQSTLSDGFSHLFQNLFHEFPQFDDAPIEGVLFCALTKNTYLQCMELLKCSKAFLRSDTTRNRDILKRIVRSTKFRVAEKVDLLALVSMQPLYADLVMVSNAIGIPAECKRYLDKHRARLLAFCMYSSRKRTPLQMLLNRDGDKSIQHRVAGFLIHNN